MHRPRHLLLRKARTCSAGPSRKEGKVNPKKIEGEGGEISHQW